MNGRNSNRHTPPLYERDDPERLEFLRQNAVSLIHERDLYIARLRAEIKRLSAKVEALKKRNLL